MAHVVVHDKPLSIFGNITLLCSANGYTNGKGSVLIIYRQRTYTFFDIGISTFFNPPIGNDVVPLNLPIFHNIPLTRHVRKQDTLSVDFCYINR